MPRRVRPFTVLEEHHYSPSSMHYDNLHTQIMPLPSLNSDQMSAPSIPNLLSTRGSRGSTSSRAPRGRATRGGARASAGHDATIQGTDTDAAVSRLSAVDLGYLDDPYAQFFVQAADGPTTRRLPIINRGTYTRTAALDTLVDAFLSDVGDDVNGTARLRQIVSLGAGTDTRPFRLFSRGLDRRPRLVYHELDFDVVCRKKLRTVETTPLLSSILPQTSSLTPPEPPPDSERPSAPSSSWSSRPGDGDAYYCHGIDLRQLSATSTASNSAPSLLPGLQTDIPTLVISECCLCYLSPEDASRCVAYFTDQIPSLATAIYEPTRPDDPFGRIMVSNLAARRIRMPTLEVYKEPKDQEERLRKAGFELARQMTIEDIWDTWIQPEEKERLDGLEGLDEVEEWKLLAAHYVVAWGSRGGGFPAWDGLGGGA